MSSMSTPVQDLPKVEGSTPPLDTSVVDVLEEMEREVAAQVHPAPMPVQTAPVMPHAAAMPHVAMKPVYVMEEQDEWFNMPRMRTAVIATLLAMLLLLPRFPGLYDRFTRLAFLEPYELYVRAAMLAIVLYLLMLRLDL
jgi:hypothetical protein